jgi:hypothetical protein
MRGCSWIPSQAVQHGPDGLLEPVMDNDTVQVHKTETGPSTGDQTIITSGLIGRPIPSSTHQRRSVRCDRPTMLQVAW